MKIIKDFRNNLLKRKELIAVVESQSNPGFDKSRMMISEKFKVGEDVISIKAIKGSFGRHEFILDVFIYDSTDDKLRIEPRIKDKKANKEGGNNV